MLQGLNQGAPVEELAPTPMLSSMPQDLNVQVIPLKYGQLPQHTRLACILLRFQCWDSCTQDRLWRQGRQNYSCLQAF